MFIRKFFNADAEEATAAPEAVAEAPQSPSQSIASMMAQGGRLNVTGETAEMPKDTAKETKASEEAPNDAVTATDTEATKGEETKEAATKKEAPQVAAPIAAPPPAPPTETWQSVLKKEQPDVVLKELGFDEKVVGFLNHWKSGGDLKEYLREMTTDYATMPAEEVMRHQLRLDYPKASESQLEILFKKKIVDAYKIDGDRYDEDEVTEGRLLLEAEADKYRDTLVERQSKFILPPPPAAKEVGPDPQVLEQQMVIENSKKSVVDSPLYRQVLSNNKITFGEGEDAFSFPVDAKELPEIIYDPSKFVESIFTVTQGQDGKVNLTADPEHQLLVAAVAKYGKGFITELSKHYKSLGGKKAIEPIENESIPSGAQAAKSEIPPSSPAAAMAKHGKLSWS